MREYTPYILAGIGYLITAIVHYYRLKSEISFVKGQLSQLMEFKDELKLLAKEQTAIKEKVMRVLFDVNNAHEKIRNLEGVRNGKQG